MFGWTKADAMDMGPMGTYQLFATGGMAVGGMMGITNEVSCSRERRGYSLSELLDRATYGLRPEREA
jgi:hypothetical protein